MKSFLPFRLFFLIFTFTLLSTANASSLQAEVTSSGGSQKQIIWDPEYDWQRITYNYEINLEFDVVYNTTRGDIYQYTIVELRGTIRFWGIAEDNYYGSYYTWDFDDTHNYTISNPSGGLLEFSQSMGKVTYVQSSLNTSTGDIQPYHLQYFGLAHPYSTRLFVDLPSSWYFDDDYDSCNPGMGIDLTDSIMLSPRADIDKLDFEYNTSYPGNWRMVSQNAWVQADFTLDSIPHSATLVIDHLCAAAEICPGGGYSPVDIIINNNIVASNYDPAENHNGLHSFVTDQWEIGPFLKTGNNTILVQGCGTACSHYWMRYLYIDNLGADCTNCNLETIRITEISATEDVPIRGVPDVIWSETQPDVFYPVADGQFDVDISGKGIELVSLAGSSISQTKYYTMPGTKYSFIAEVPESIGSYTSCLITWEILDTNNTLIDSGTCKLENNENGFIVNPKKNMTIGQYKLKLLFSFLDDTGNLAMISPPQKTEHNLYVIHSDQTLMPDMKEEYLLKATQFANGVDATDTKKILETIMNNFTDSKLGWKYEYWQRVSYQDLLYNNIQYGSCGTYATAMDHLCRTLGIPTILTEYSVNKLFLTDPESVALDSSAGNAFTDNQDSNRWVFPVHYFVEYASGWLPISKFYDPTFTETYDRIDEYVCAILDKVSHFGIPYESGGGYDVFKLSPPNWYRKFRYEPISVFIGDQDTNIWFVGVIEGDTGLQIAQFDVILSRGSQELVEVSYSTKDGSATAPDDYTAKRNETLIFQPGQTHKTIEIEIKGDPNEENAEYFTIELTSADAYIPQSNTYMLAGMARCVIIDDDSSTLRTNAIEPQFNTPVYFTGIHSSYGLDTNSDGVFENLVLSVEVDGLSGEYYVSGSLLNDGITISERKTYFDEVSTDASLNLSGTSSNFVDILFSGEDIFQSDIDGNYQVAMILSDANGVIWDLGSIDIADIDHAEFGEYPVRFRSVQDALLDDDIDGLYDWLAIDIGLNIFEENEYYAVASLSEDPNAPLFMVESGQLSTPDSNSIRINFDGRYLYERNLDGSYTVNISLYDPNDNYITSKEYTTAAYHANMFKHPPITLTGNSTDNVSYSEGHCPMNQLIIDVEFMVQEPNTYELNAGLYGNDANIIQVVPLEIQLAQGTSVVSFEFDGNVINENGIDGPYYLGYVAVRQKNDQGNGYLSIFENVHQTETYPVCGFDAGSSFLSGDINCSCYVNMEDLVIFVDQWLQSPGIPSGDIAPEPRDNIVNFLDFVRFSQDWLASN